MIALPLTESRIAAFSRLSPGSVPKLRAIALPFAESRIAAFSRLSPSTVSKLRAIAQYLTVLQKLVSGGELSWFPGFQGFDDVMVMLNEGICESDRS
jgi:hypothetical protein